MLMKNKIMKNINIVYIITIIVLSTSGCIREKLTDTVKTEKRILICSFENNEAGSNNITTKTSITRYGKTVWKVGDKIWVSNGINSDTLTVSSEYDGKKYCEFNTDLKGKLYIVYPLSVSRGIDASGKIKIEIPHIQDGTFASSNIAVAVAEDRYVKMKNVTSVLKFRIPEDAKPVKAVSIIGAGNKPAGYFTVDMTNDIPNIVSTDLFNDIIVKTDGLSGNFYATVVPGVYNAGFSMSAITIDLHNAYESKSTSTTKTLAINEFYDLGNIGYSLKSLKGDGSSNNPWLISNFFEMLAFTYYVNDGNTMEGQYIKLTDNIKTVTIPIGLYNVSTQKGIAFRGNFDGGNKTITVDLNQTGKDAMALFANVSDGSNIHNVNIEGHVKSNYDYVGSLIGFLNASSSVKISDCMSSANVEGFGYVGGLIAYTSSPKKIKVIDIERCVNKGTVKGHGRYVGGLAGSVNYTKIRNTSNVGYVEGTQCVGGISGNTYSSELTKCVNTGKIFAFKKAGDFGKLKGKRWSADYLGGAAGISGYSYGGSKHIHCDNSGTIEGVNKTGGIVGASYWGSIESCTNSGNVLVSDEAGGGITGWIITHSSINGCTNTGKITVQKNYSGGIIGIAQSYHKSAKIVISKCYNEGEIVSYKGQSVGGILGHAYVMNNVANITVDKCANKERGEVSGVKLVGGIIGSEDRYSDWSRMNIYNCENHAKITGTGIGDKTEVNIGGIFGGMIHNTKQQGVMIKNCYNTGNVEYADASDITPNAGGIAGYLNHGANAYITNVYNSGKVGPKSGEMAESASCGAIIGFNVVQQSKIGNAYYLKNSCPYVISEKSKYTDYTNIISVDKVGNLETPAVIGSNQYNTIHSALDAWSKSDKEFYRWTYGPKFKYE